MPGGRRHAEAMQVPVDLADRLTRLAHERGKVPQMLLREALRQWMEEVASAYPATEPRPGDAQPYPAFVPQTGAFSVYE